MKRPSRLSRTGLAALLLFSVVHQGKALPKLKPVKKSAQELRADYLTRLHEQYMPPPDARTVGSLWSAANALGDLSSDYRARNVNDTIVVQVSVQDNRCPERQCR